MALMLPVNARVSGRALHYCSPRLGVEGVSLASQMQTHPHRFQPRQTKRRANRGIVCGGESGGSALSEDVNGELGARGKCLQAQFAEFVPSEYQLLGSGGCALK